MSKLKVLGISGSLREASLNRKAIQVAKKIAAEAGAEVNEVDLRGIPMYDQDIEDKGFPESVETLRAAIEKADVILIASPEYNYSISGAIKNAIDWVSRGGNLLKGKTVAIFGASPGAFGTVRMQPHLRYVLQALGVYILPKPEVQIMNASEAFDEEGNLTNEKSYEKLKELVENTLDFAEKLK